MLSISIKAPADILTDLGRRAKEARLALGWTRGTLAERSGVPEATIKRFETCGQIGTAALVDLAIALDGVVAFEHLFAPMPIQSVSEITHRKRKRGSI